MGRYDSKNKGKHGNIEENPTKKKYIQDRPSEKEIQNQKDKDQGASLDKSFLSLLYSCAYAMPL